MLIVWGRATSVNVQKVMWAVGEIGIAHERIDVGGRFGGLDAPAYLAMNPHRRVPTIDDDGVIVWESNAIVRYLAARYSNGVRWDRDPERITHAGCCQSDKLQGSRYCNNLVRDFTPS